MKNFNLKTNLMFAIMFIFSGILFAQQDSVKNWKVGGDASLTFSQITLSNWAAGGKSSIAGTFMTNGFANYKKNKTIWDNSLFVGYGLTKQEGENTMKTDDRLLLTSKYGYAASKSWYYSAMADFKTQLTQGFSNPPENTNRTSDFMSPAFLSTSLGMSYQPNDIFSLYISPVTCKMTFVMDDSLSAAGAYGVEAGKNSRAEYGASMKAVYKKEDILKNLDFYTRLDLFSNLIDNPGNIDVDWEARLNYRFTNYLTAVLSLNLLYDDDTKTIDEHGIQKGAKVQTKQLLGFGINFKF